jgi:hypothetical protein
LKEPYVRARKEPVVNKKLPFVYNSLQST